MKHSRCNTCKVLSYTTCPIQEEAYNDERDIGMDCEVADMIDRYELNRIREMRHNGISK